MTFPTRAKNDNERVLMTNQNLAHSPSWTDTDSSNETSVMIHRMERELCKMEGIVKLVEANSKLLNSAGGEAAVNDVKESVVHCLSVLSEHYSCYCKVAGKIDQLEDDHKEFVFSLIGIEFGDCQRIDYLKSRFTEIQKKLHTF